ncbi:MAG: hypothetical protein ABR610_04570 [Thermoanaerobaculia bacterium]
MSEIAGCAALPTNDHRDRGLVFPPTRVHRAEGPQRGRGSGAATPGDRFDFALSAANNVTHERVLLSRDRERGFRRRMGYLTKQPRTIGFTTRVDF